MHSQDEYVRNVNALSKKCVLTHICFFLRAFLRIKILVLTKRRSQTIKYYYYCIIAVKSMVIVLPLNVRKEVVKQK